MPPLRYVVARSGRRFSPSAGKKVEEKRDFPGLRCISTAVGYFLGGPLLFGDEVSKAEKDRQEDWKQIFGESAEFGHLKPGLWESISSLRESIWSEIRENATSMLK